MNTTRKYEQELEDLTKNVAGRLQPFDSEEEHNAIQEKLSEAKAALVRLKERVGDAVHDLEGRGDEVWGDFQDRLRDLRSFVEARFAQRKKGDR